MTARLRLIADGVVAAGLALGGKPGGQLEDAYKALEWAVAEAFPSNGSTGNRAKLDAMLAKGLTPTVDTDYERWQPLHWAIEVPDVMERGGFDAIIGNPPFLVHKRLTGAIGENLREYCMNTLASGRRGKCDQVVFFLLRGAGLVHSAAPTVGLVVSKAIAEGSTREVGLAAMVEGEAPQWRLYRAIRSRSWPGSASVYYSAIWLAMKWNGEIHLDGLRVESLNSMLDAESGESKPPKLAANSRICHQGIIPQGKGFVLSPQDYSILVQQDGLTVQVVKPYLDGHDITDDPQFKPSRYVIDFGEMPEDDARKFNPVFRIAEERIRPERLTKDKVKYPRMVNEWWKHWNPRLELRRGLAKLKECLVIVGHAKYVIPVRVPADYLPSSALRVFVSEDYSLQAFLSSAPHIEWAIKWGSTLGESIRYNPSVVFETIPRPRPTPALEGLGRALEEDRCEVMVRRNIGLTDLYNLINAADTSADTDIDRMREIHVEIDRAVLAAYGWDDIPLDHGFHTHRRMERFTVSSAARVEVLDRLLKENNRRAGILDKSVLGEQSGLYS